jgi:hypothetical protein
LCNSKQKKETRQKNFLPGFNQTFKLHSSERYKDTLY